jgi:hypothetical protein
MQASLATLLLALGLLLHAAVSPAQAYTCETVRWAHQTYGMAQLVRWAQEYRLTAAQRKAALACLRKKELRQAAQR